MLDSGLDFDIVSEFLWGGSMELAIVTIAILIGASQIPGDYHVVFFR